MLLSPLLPFALLQAALCLVASAATNYSIDDQDPLFQYSGTWIRVNTNFNPSGGNLDRDGGHMLTYTPGSSATITYTFASVYYLAALWPYAVSTNYGIDSNPPVTIDLQDHSIPPQAQGGNATVASGVVGQWTSTANQEHTIHITIPSGGQFAVVDMFIFEVLDPSDTTTSATSQTSSSAGTTSGTASPSSSSSSSSSGSSSGSGSSSESGSASGSQGLSSTVARDLAISMAVVGTSLAVLLIFLLWRFCIRRKGKNGGRMTPITPQYQSVPTIGGHDPFNDNMNSVSMRSDVATSRYGLGIQNNNLYRPPITLNNDRGISPPMTSGPPSTLYTDQSASLLPYAPQVHHNLNPQRRMSTLSMMSDRPPMYCPNPTLDGSAPISLASSSIGITNEGSSSSSGNTNEKNGRIPMNTLYYTGVAEPEVEPTSTMIPRRQEENINSTWDNGYPQPPRFVPLRKDLLDG